MISESCFNTLKEQTVQYPYTTFPYLSYETCCQANVLVSDPSVILLLDQSQAPAKVYFAAKDFKQVIALLQPLNLPLQINFVPHEYKENLQAIGFQPWAEYIDFFNASLADTKIHSTQMRDVTYLHREECAQVSAVSRRCAHQSRGFTGETEVWFSCWINENDVIIARKDGLIVGFCCVSIYNQGSTLWIREIAVDPVYQNQGYGKKLMAQAIGYGMQKGAQKGFLAADVLNDRAIGLYQQYGFTAKDTTGELQMRKP